jgi:hypothetical protein
MAVLSLRANSTVIRRVASVCTANDRAWGLELTFIARRRRDVLPAKGLCPSLSSHGLPHARMELTWINSQKAALK